jgi:predicted O-methyltransferase YrrM
MIAHFYFCRRLLLLLFIALSFNLSSAQEKAYNFSTGHHLYHEENWTRILAPYKGRPDIRYLEVGVFEGRSLVWMLENILTDATARATGIDIFPGDMKDIYVSNLNISGFADKVTTITGYSQFVLRDLPPQSFDIIYIDGSHVACDVLSDATLGWLLLKNGGTMIFDDYLYGLDLPTDLRPQVSIDSFITAFRNSLDIVAHSYQVMVRKKQAWPGTFPLGRYAYYWGNDEFCKGGLDNKVELTEKEKEVIREIILSRKFGELGYSPGGRILEDPVYQEMAERLGLDAAFNRGSPADIPVRGDFDGDGRADAAVWVRNCAVWLVRDRVPVLFGAPGDIPVPGDYDGDGKTDIAVFKPSSGTWMADALSQMDFGADGDIPVPGDYDGNGTDDIAIYRPSKGTWAIKDQFSAEFGDKGDIPVPGDYDGDGIDTLAVFRPSWGTWMFRNRPPVKFGEAGDIPIPGDYDGDGADDIAVFRPSTGTWMIKGLRPLQFGAKGDIPVPGDYDGNGRLDIAVYSPASAEWAVYGQYRIPFGSRDRIPFVR